MILLDTVQWTHTSKLQFYTIGVICVFFYLLLSPLSPLYVCFCLLCSVWFCICLSLRCQYCTNIPRCFCNLSLGFCDLVLYLPLSFLSILYRCICVLCLCLVFCVLCLCSEFCLLCGSKYASLFLVNIVFLCFCDFFLFFPLLFFYRFSSFLCFF